MYTGLLTVMPGLPMHIPSVQECDATMTNRSYLNPYHNHPILKHGSSLAQRISMGYGLMIESIVYLLVFCLRSCRGVLLCCLCLHLLNNQLSQDPPTAKTPQAQINPCSLSLKCILRLHLQCFLSIGVFGCYFVN